jgi:hypothetical protein
MEPRRMQGKHTLIATRMKGTGQGSRPSSNPSNPKLNNAVPELFAFGLMPRR